MWIKSLDDPVWVSMNHVTDFIVSEALSSTEGKGHEVTAFLDTSSKIFIPHDLSSNQQQQANVVVYRGTHEECVGFVDKQIFYQGLYQWIGYLVAGGVGAVLTLIFQKFIP